jgi:NAD(P)-dependent dehydrogenase (short-subunit alcohol dehydrogenase family)
VVAELKARGVQAAAFKADQASPEAVETLVNDVAKHFGRLDILVNNAGVATGGAVDNSKASLKRLSLGDIP